MAPFGLARSVGGVSIIAALALGLVSCGPSKMAQIDPKYGVSPSPRMVAEGEDVPKGGGYAKVGKPYVIAGETYVPTVPKTYSAVGTASWYGADFHGRKTANGELFDTASITAAHRTLPMPSYIRVTNMMNGRSIIARVNDRGPFHSSRLIDVSEPVAKALAFRTIGTAKVKVDYIGQAPLEGSDDGKLLASLRTDGKPAMLIGDARAPVQVASADGAFDTEVAATEPTLPALVASLDAESFIDGDVPFPVPRPQPVRTVSLISPKPLLAAPVAQADEVVQTASIPPMPVPRPGGMFYLPTGTFAPATSAFDGLKAQKTFQLR